MRQNNIKENPLLVPVDSNARNLKRDRTDFDEALARYTRQRLAIARQAQDLMYAHPDQVLVSGEPGVRLDFRTQVDLPTGEGNVPMELTLTVQKLQDGSLESSLGLQDITGIINRRPMSGLYRLTCTTPRGLGIAENTGLLDAFSSFQPNKDSPDIVTDNFAESVLKVGKVSRILSEAQPRLPEPGIGEEFGKQVTLADLLK